MSDKTNKYDYDANTSLCNFVRMKYRNHLSNGAMQIYLLGMPFLEQRKSGFCKTVIASYEEIGNAACKDYSGLKKLLLELKKYLCDIQFGSNKGKKIATTIRRYTIAELSERIKQTGLTDNEPAHAKELSAILENRIFVYGTDLACNPFWNIKKTGRIYSKDPHVQGDSKEKRGGNLLYGLKDEQFLFDVDIKHAEPSIIQQVIGYSFDNKDPYNLYAGIMQIPRDMAKQEINMLAYCEKAVRVVEHWKPELQKWFMSYAQELDKYKEKLWESGKPFKPLRRFVDTLGNTRIFADKGKRTHRGQLMNWHIQGTVADIINVACLEVISLENEKGWRFLFPVHDSFYVIGKEVHAKELEQIVVSKAKNLNLNLSVEVNLLFEKSNKIKEYATV